MRIKGVKVNEYEIAIVFDPDLEVDISKPKAKVEKIFKDNKGKVKKTDEWGKKKLAYKIAGQDHGLYIFYTVELNPESVSKVESVLNITDEVLRYLITKVDHKTLAKAEAIKAEKAEKAAKQKSDDNNENEE